MTGEGHLWGEGSNYPPIRAVLQGKVQMWVHSSQHLQTERGRWVQHYRCATIAWCILDLQGQPLSPRPYILSKTAILGFLGSTVDENPPSNAGTQVQSLVLEDPTCQGAIEPVCHNYWASALEFTSCNDWSLCTLELMLHRKSHCNEKLMHHN